MDKSPLGHNYMKKIVAVCIVTDICFAAATFVAACCGVDTTQVLAIVTGVFGLELLMTAVIKIAGDKKEG